MAKAYADLSSAVIDLEHIREAAQRSLLAALDSRPGPKALVLDPRLGGPLTQICQMPTLRQHSVDRLFHLEVRRRALFALNSKPSNPALSNPKPYTLSALNHEHPEP